MFILSVKAEKRRLIPVILSVALIAAMLIASFVFPASRTMVAGTTVAASDDEETATYLKTLGYTVTIPADSVREIALPDVFDETLSHYNAMQREAGFDLSSYAGQRVKYRTYTLRDHESGADAAVHLYTADGRILGGDIVSADGTLLPLSPVSSCPT